MTIKDQLKKDFLPVLKKLRISENLLSFEHPMALEHGDFSTNIAFRIGIGSPMEMANKIVGAIRSGGMPDYIAKIEVAQPGFINIWLSENCFISQIDKVLKEGDGFGKLTILKGKKILLEHTSPNPQTTIMLGHLRNNFLGMSISNLLKCCGAKVTKDCIVNDRGVHICRSIFGYLAFAGKNSELGKKQLLNFREITDKQIKQLTAKTNWKDLILAWKKKKTSWLTYNDLNIKADHSNLIWYVLGSRAYELSESVKAQAGEILKAWEVEQKEVLEIWQQIMNWSKDGYAETYKRVGSAHDWVWYESQLYKGGKELVEKGLKKGVFQKSEGAIVTNLAKYGFSDGVVIKSDGTSTYYVFDLNLTAQKIKRFPSDLYIWDIGEEQTLYFRQLFAVCEQLGIGKREKFYHLSYALINFKGSGKMSTRQGNVVMADEVLDLLKSRALEIIKNSNQELRGKLSAKQLDMMAEQVAVGALKYSLLKYARETTIHFDINESLSLEGDSGPYLQYTYARCKSVIEKWEMRNEKLETGSGKREARSGNSENQKNLKITPQNLASHLPPLTSEELMILRTLYKFPEIIESATENYSPNLICSYLFDLAQKYNNFYNRHRILMPVSSSAYNKHRILGGAKDIENFRILLTSATAQVLKNGLALLGINTPERM